MWDQEQYIKAWNFASVAHNQQLVPGINNTYINHIGLVAMEVMSACSQQTIAQPTLAVLCALLHDTIEDTAISYDELVEQFGLEVANGVLSLTKDNLSYLIHIVIPYFPLALCQHPDLHF